MSMERDFNFGDDVKGNNDLGSDDRPPLYNPEDYVSGLRRFSKLTGLQLYVSNSLHSAEHDNNNKVHCFVKGLNVENISLHA